MRAKLNGRERLLFDVLCSAGELGYRLPDDDINLRHARGVKDPRKRLAREYSAGAGGNQGSWATASDRLAGVLVKELGVKNLKEEDRLLRVLLGCAPIALAPDCAVPQDPVHRAAWDTTVTVFGKLFPKKIKSLGPLELVQRRLTRLRREIAEGMKIGRAASGRNPGPEARRLAVDAELIDVVEKAFKKEMEPGYIARYLYYTKPGDHIWPHPDDPKYAITVLIGILHESPYDSATSSAFVAYQPDGTKKRYQIAPGSALALEPGLIHAREPIREGERVALLSIGLCHPNRLQ